MLGLLIEEEFTDNESRERGDANKDIDAELSPAFCVSA